MKFTDIRLVFVALVVQGLLLLTPMSDWCGPSISQLQYRLAFCTGVLFVIGLIVLLAFYRFTGNDTCDLSRWVSSSHPYSLMRVPWCGYFNSHIVANLLERSRQQLQLWEIGFRNCSGHRCTIISSLPNHLN